MKSLTDAALEWAALGIPVFPCAPVTKSPLTANGFYDASTDPETVKQLFSLSGEDTLIGARMGEASGLFAVDLDIYKPGAAGKAAQQYMAQLIADGLMPDTQRHKTMSGGLHVIYASDTTWPNCKPSDGVEVKGEGGYIILPPSKGYSIEDGDGFTEAPEALIESLMKARRAHTDKTVQQHINSITQGRDFHDSITSIAAKMYSQGRRTAEIYGVIREALEGSVASNPHHARHQRWDSLMTDASGEVARILNSGREKFDSNAKIENAKAHASQDTIERISKAAEGFGFASPPEGNFEPAEEPKAEDYGGEWPFEGEGYFASDDFTIDDQAFVMHPLYAEAESVVLAAAPKSGKTAISLKLAVHVAAGRDLGPFKVPAPKGVLYYAMEGTRAIKLRVEAEKRAQKDAGTPLPEQMPMFVVERPSNMIKAQDEQVAKIIAADIYMRDKLGVPLGLVVIDTLTKAMPGADQNSVDDTSALFDLTAKLRTAGITATVVFVHHTGKDGSTRGSSNIEADVDLVLKIKKQEDNTSLMFVHLARSIDDGGMYRFALTNYALGQNQQGIEQSAPVVTLTEGTVDTGEVTEAAQRAQKIQPFLRALLSLGPGQHTLSRVFQHWRDGGQVTGRNRRKEAQAALDLIFDRDAAVTFDGFVISKEGDYLIIAAPGDYSSSG